MSNNLIQPSFAAGELAPSLYARVDVNKYHVGAALVENFVVDYRGGIFNRPGTEFVGQCKSSDKTVVLIPFQFSVIQTYILEFGNLYMRVIKDGAYVTQTPIAITGITRAAQGVVSTAPQTLAVGDWVFLTGIGGMTELNGKTVIVGAGPTSTSFALLDLQGNPIDTTNYHAYSTGGTFARIYTLATPYAAADLQNLKYTQSADVMTLTHTSYAPRDLTRTGHANWTLTAISFATNMVPPTGVTAVASAAGAAVYAYVVTSVGLDGQESIASVRGDLSGAVNIAATAGHIDISWTAPGSGAPVDYYNIYKAAFLPTAGTIPAGVNFGWIGDATGLAFVDNNITPDFTKTPPLANNPFASNNHPGAVGYFQQRRTFAGSTLQPETIWGSQPGAFSNFDVSNPIKDDDSIEATLSSRQVNNIKFMIAMPGGLVVLTGGGAWQVSGGSANAAITPSSIQATPQAYNGCADIEPITINYDILYVQQRGNVVRDLSYNFYVNNYTGIDISLLANHLLRGFTLTRWAYAEEPFKVVWAVRNDGKLLSLTYLKEQEVYGWAHHHTLGLFQSVATIQEGTENAVYVVVKRLINGNYVQYVERMQSDPLTYGVEDAWYVDSGLQNALTYPNATLTASAATGTGVVFIADSPVFAPGDVGKILRMGGGIATVTTVAGDGLSITGNLTRDIQNVIYGDPSVYQTIPADIPLPVAPGEWSLAAEISSISGLDHLEGQIVTILADGSVQPQKTVTNGKITLDSPASKVTVGLPYASRLQTLDIDTGEPTIQGKRKKISALTVRVAYTRGIKMGSTFNTMTEFKQRSTQPMGTPVEPAESEDQRIIMDPSWQEPGRICVRQDYPLPAHILGIIPEMVVGDTKS